MCRDHRRTRNLEQHRSAFIGAVADAVDRDLNLAILEEAVEGNGPRQPGPGCPLGNRVVATSTVSP